VTESFAPFDELAEAVARVLVLARSQQTRGLACTIRISTIKQDTNEWSGASAGGWGGSTFALLDLRVAVVVIGGKELLDPLDLVGLHRLGQSDRVRHLIVYRNKNQSLKW
jgi:hypothetical protein